jgi:16S rRNA (adenine1518-N6/adenine1519-N6)-dimethyltransferase
LTGGCDTENPTADAASALPPLREIIARYGLAARHSLGQHFLLDGNLTDRIVREAGDLTGRHVIEVGPGPGGLTRSLLASAAAGITAIELDPRAVAALSELVAGAAGRLQVIEADALSIDAADLTPAPRQIVANLPYNVASPLLVAWLRRAALFERLTVMFQLEVAERICAEADTEAYGRLSVLTGWTCEARIAMRIPPTAFTPPPKVWSAVVSLTPHASQPPAALFARMESLTAAAFGQRRKMLRRSLRSLGGEALLAQAGIAAERRAETLSVAEFDRLAGILGPLDRSG